jgi:drug/metabolite transporter (DMT)-like permease
MHAQSPKTLHFTVLAILAAIWGSSFILMKRGLMDADQNPVYSPSQVAALRLAIAGLILLPVSAGAVKSARKEDWKWISLVGLLGSGIPAFLFANSQQYLDSSLAGILNALTPLFTLFAGILLFRATVRPSQITGVVIGLIGAAGMIAISGIGNSVKAGYALLIVLATLSYGLSVNTIQFKLRHIHPLQLASLSMLLIGIPCMVIALCSGATEVALKHPSGLHSLGFIAVLGVMGTALANVLFFWLTGATSALFSASVTYLIPIVAVFWGVSDGERITPAHLGCGAVILAGVWLVRRK